MQSFDDWEKNKPEQNSGIFGDSIDMLQSGAIDTAAGVASFVGAEETSNSLNKWSQSQYETLSPEGQASMAKTLINDDLSLGEGATDPRTWWLNSMSVLGGMAVTIGPAGALGKAASVAGKLSKVASVANKAEAIGGGTSMIVNGFLNGAAGNGQSARGVADDIRNLDFQDLRNSEKFKSLTLEYSDQGLSSTDAMDRARDDLATEAGESLRTDFSLFALNGVVGAVGDHAFSKLLSGTLGKTVKGAMAKGMVSEGGTEFVQGYGETVIGNKAREEQTQEGRDLTSGAAAQGLTGAILGAGIGGTGGAVGSQVGKVRRRGFEKQIETVVNPENITKMRASGMKEPDIRSQLKEQVSNQAINLGFETDEANNMADTAVDYAFGKADNADTRHATEDATEQATQQAEQPQPEQPGETPLTWSEENGYPNPQEFGLSEQDAELIIDPPADLLRADGTINPKAPKELKQAYQIAQGRAEAQQYMDAVFNQSAPQREQSQQYWKEEAEQNINWQQQQQNPETVQQDQQDLAESLRAGDLGFVDEAARQDANFAEGLRRAMEISPAAVLEIAQMRRDGQMSQNQALSAMQRVINSTNNHEDTLEATPEELELRTQANQERAQQQYENMPQEQRRQEIQNRLLQGQREQQFTNAARGESRPNGERVVNPQATGIENQFVQDAPQVEFDRWSDAIAGDENIDQRYFNSPYAVSNETQVLDQDTVYQPRQRGEQQTYTEPAPTAQEIINQNRGQRGGVLAEENTNRNARQQKKAEQKERAAKEEIYNRLPEQEQEQQAGTEYQPNTAMGEAFETARTQPEQQAKPEEAQAAQEPTPEPVKPAEPEKPKKAPQAKIGDNINEDLNLTKLGKDRWEVTFPNTDIKRTIQIDRPKKRIVIMEGERFDRNSVEVFYGVAQETPKPYTKAARFKLLNDAIGYANARINTDAERYAKATQANAKWSKSGDAYKSIKSWWLDKPKAERKQIIESNPNYDRTDRTGTAKRRIAISSEEDFESTPSSILDDLENIQLQEYADSEIADAKKAYQATPENDQLGLDRIDKRIGRLNKIKDGKGSEADLNWLRSEYESTAKGETPAEKAEVVNQPIAKERFAKAKSGKSDNPRMQAWLDTLEQDELDQINSNADYMSFITKRKAEFLKANRLAEGKDLTKAEQDQFDKFIRAYANRNLSDRVKKGNPEPEPPKPTKKKAPTKETKTNAKGEKAPAGLSDFSEGVKAVNAALNGKYSFDEFKKMVQTLSDSEEAIRAKLYESPVVKRKRKQDVKDSLVNQNFNRLVYGIAQAISPNYGSYEGFDVFSKKSALEQVQERVNNLTEGEYNQNIANRQQQRAKSQAEEKARQEGLKNPETVADFRRLAYSKDVELNEIATILDNDQLAKFDKLAVEALAEKQESAFQHELERRGNVEAVEGIESVGHETEVSTFDDGAPSYVVRLTDRVGKEKWKELAQAARRIDRGVKVANARYAKSAGKPEGWHFTSQEASNQFVQLLGGEAVNATENVAAQAEAKATSAREKQVNKLTKLAESLNTKAEEVLNQERKTNTAKRAGDAARVMNRAYSQQEDAGTLQKIAEGVEKGDITVLGGLQDLTQLDELNTLSSRILWNMTEKDREKFAERDNMGRWHIKESTKFSDIVRFAKFPDPEVNAASLGSLAREMATVKGYLNTGKFIAKQVQNHGNDNVISLGGPLWAKHIAKIRAFAKIQKYGAADRANELFKTEGRLNRMGVVDNATLREALRELDQIQSGVETSKPVETPITKIQSEIEQKVRGNRKAYVDFFPTDNAKLADSVIEQADIQEGMKVLEPSAGMGDLADRIAAKGADLDVGDISSDMRALLEAKGHNVVGDDFLQYKSDPVYDRIVMNPPFNNDSAIEHINHALSMLKEGGRLVAITPINTGDKGNTKNKNFREYLDAVGAVEETNSEGSFKDSLNPTMVNTKTIVIDKPTDAANLPVPEDIRFSQTSEVTGSAKGIELKAAIKQAEDFINNYEGFKDVNVTVLQNQDQLADIGMTVPNTKVKGVWLSGDNRVVIIANNIDNAADLRRVLRHELIAHSGLYANLSGAEIDSLTTKVNSLRNNRRVKALFAEVDKAYKKAPDQVKAEEVIARLAEVESGPLRNVADRILASVMGALRRSGVLSKDNISLAEVRTMINNVDKYLRTNKGEMRAPDIVRYAQTVSQEDAAEMDLGNPTMAYEDAINQAGDNFYKQMMAKGKTALKGNSWLDAAKGAGWGLLTLRQIADVAKNKVSPNYSAMIDSYVETVNRKMSRQNELLLSVEELSNDIRQWIRKGNKEQADELFNFMHESTIANVDPSRPYEDMTDLLTDMIAIKEEQIKGRSGEGKKQLFEELKQYKQDLKGEPFRRKAHAKMKVLYDNMDTDQKKYFNDVRDHYEKQQDEMFKALIDRAAKLSLTGKGTKNSKVALNIHNRLIKEFGKTHAAELGKLGSSDIALELAIAKKGYYVPLARFGKYWVSTKWESGKKPSGDLVLDSQYEMFESEAQMMERVNQLRKAGFKPKYGMQMEDSEMISGATMGFVTDFMDNINQANMTEDAKENLKDDLYQMFLQSLPQRSIRKSFIHRKGTKGYSTNALQALSDQGFKQSRQQARLETEDDLNATITGINKLANETSNNVSAQRIADEMNKRNEWVNNPKRAKWAQKATGLGFFMLIGASPASALINLTQTVQIGIPVIGGKYGYAATAAEMGRLTKLWMTNRYAASKDQNQKNRYGVLGSILEGEEREAMRKAVLQGTIDVTQTSDALSLAEQPDAVIGDWKDRVFRTLGWGFHNAEVLNREVTFLTAYRLARKSGESVEAAQSYATKATWDSHFDYGSLNRARFMQGDVATVALQFKQYSQNMTYYLLSNAMKSLKMGNPTQEQVSQARKELLGAMTLTFAMGGLSALPIATIAAIANMVHAAVGDPNDPWEAETELKGILTEWFGEDWASTLYNGLPPTVGLPAIGSRINVDLLGMWMRHSDATTASGTLSDIGAQAFGPIGGIIVNAARGIDYASQGRGVRALESVTPKWIKDIVKVGRYASEGGNITSRNGEVIMGDVTGVEYAQQMLGFTPTRLQDQYDLIGRVRGYETKIKARRSLLLNQLWVSYMKKDREEMANIRAHIKVFNNSEWGRLNPITSAQMSSSIKSRLKLQEKTQGGIRYSQRYETLIKDKFLQN